MPIVSNIRSAFIKEGQPHRGSQPTKALCRARAYVRWSHPCVASYPRSGAKVRRIF